nr:gephyrin-like molybdotransferase receptor GlpR [Streptomyces spiramenti]
MRSRKPLYRVTVNSHGLIFAMIVGAWAAYLVPMWLRRQDELNEARPTERFSTAIRLLSGRAGLERRSARDTERRRRRSGTDTDAGEPTAASEPDGPVYDEAEAGADHHPGSAARSDPYSDLRGYADPVTELRDLSEEAPEHAPRSATPDRGAAHEERSGVRAKVLVRRRRVTMLLFLTFAGSGIVAMSVGGPLLMWLPVAPAVLLSVYIVHLRRQERRRYAVTMDRRRAEEAARRLRERPRPQPVAPEPVASPAAEGRRALVEQTDHAEWVDQERSGGAPDAEGWEPAPVPLPTYVNAPVAPRSNRTVDLDAPDTWSAARSTTAGGAAAAVPGPATSGSARPQRTPLFDQYDERVDEERPRAAGE